MPLLGTPDLHDACQGIVRGLYISGRRSLLSCLAKSPVDGLIPIIEVPVKSSWGSHHLLKGLYLLKVSCILMVHLVVSSCGAVCLMSCS